MKDGISDMDAIKDGATAAPIVAELKAEEARNEVLVLELAELEQVTTVASMEDKRLLREVQAQAADIRRLMLEQVAKARQMFRKLDVRVVCDPIEENGKKGYRFTLTGTYMRILGSVNVGCGPFPAPTISATTR